MSIKSMIARCIARMRAGACATCDNRQFCPAGRWQQAFAIPREAGRRTRESRRPSGLLAFLGQIAASLDGGKTPYRTAVRECLEPMLASGDVGIERVAAKLGLSRQTLYRRLKAEG